MTALERVVRTEEEIDSLWAEYRSACETVTSAEVCQFQAPSFSVAGRFNFIDWPEDYDEEDYEP